MALSQGTHFDVTKDLDEIDATMKFGTHYIGWREKEFTNPFVEAVHAVHFNARKLKEYAIPRFKNIWTDKFSIINGYVSEIVDDGDTVSIVIDNQTYHFDYLIDCSGFPKDFEGYIIPDGMPINHALIYNNFEEKNPPYGAYFTQHIATPNGWMFKIPLQSRTSYGYMYNDNITEKEDAMKNFNSLINKNLDDFIEYSFHPYYAKAIANNRIFKNGNAAVFFEPMFGNAIWLYDQINKIIFKKIFKQIDEETANRLFLEYATDVEHLINYHYQGGSTIDSIFWNTSKEVAKHKLSSYLKLKIVSDILKSYDKRNVYAPEPVWFFTPVSLRALDNGLGYNYFTIGEKI